MTLNNIGITEGQDAFILVDDINGTGYPVSKMIIGTENVSDGFVDANNPVPMYTPQSLTAFGDSLVALKTEQVSSNFTYEVNPDTNFLFSFGQSNIISASGKLIIEAGPTANSIGAVVSRRTINYRPGAGATARFTAGFDIDGSGTNEGASAGLGTEENALLFNYASGTMNIVHRRHGQRDSRLLDITTGSSASGNIVVTLDGNEITGTVTGNTSFTANTASELALSFPSLPLLIAGYSVASFGSHVEFSALRTGPKAGSFGVDFGTSTATGTFTQSATGVIALETSIPQSDWNQDIADGTQTLPNIDWTLGNVFQIKYQWLGFGIMEFFVEDPIKGAFVRVHGIHHPNTSRVPSLSNPNMPLIYVVGNGSSSNTDRIFGSSAAGFLEGGQQGTSFVDKKSVFATNSIGTTETPLIAFCMPQYYKGKSNQTLAEFIRVQLDSNGAGQFSIYKGIDTNPIYLEGDVTWLTVSENTMSLYTEDATGFSGGNLQEIFRVNDGVLNLAPTADEIDLFNMLPGELILVTAAADGGNLKFGSSFTWIENK